MKDRFEIKEVDDILGDLSKVDARINDLVVELRRAINKQFEVIRQLKDENESLWFMLEEMRASDIKNWAEQGNNKDILQDSVDEHLAKIAIMKNSQGDA